INTGTAALTLLMTTVSGLGFMMFGVWITLLSDRFSLELLSAATSGLFLASSLIGLTVGRLVRERDVRGIIAVGGVFGCASLFLFPHIGASLGVLAAVYLLFAVAFSCSGVMIGQALITRWFRDQKSRSARLALVTTGLSIGGIFIAPLATSAVYRFGIDVTMPALGVIYLGASLVTVLMLDARLTRPRPGAHQTGGQALRPGELPLIIGLGLGCLLFMGSNVGGMQHIYNVCATLFGESWAVWSLSALSGSSFFSRFAGSWLMRRFGIFTYTVAVLLVQSVSVVLLPNAETLWQFALYTVLFGTTVSNVIMVQSLLCSELLVSNRYAVLFPRISMMTGFGIALGPLLAGYVAGAVDYSAAYALLGGLSLLALLVFAVILKRRQTATPEAADQPDASSLAS
ncbi:MAG: MFS transporter, partial [Gammaproteobacteria bacterium AqS3]|nr:MFS transporter [Gammaproteobacteria bacterium AqS3]